MRNVLDVHKGKIIDAYEVQYVLIGMQDDMGICRYIHIPNQEYLYPAGYVHAF